jgi:molecular chaperone IbpA
MATKHVYTTLDISDLHRFAVGFDTMFHGLNRTAGTLSTTNYPPYNIIQIKNDKWHESITQFAVEIAVAGFEESELDVEIIDTELVIKGEHIQETSSDAIYLHQGIAARNFVRAFALAENVEVKGATVKNGILTVTLEHIMPEATTPKKVAISFQK